MRVALAVLLLVALDEFVSSDQPGAARNTKKKKKKKKNQPEVEQIEKKKITLKRKDMCAGCASFVEEYHRAMREEYERRGAEDRRIVEGTVDVSSLWKRVRDVHFAKFSQSVRYALDKLSGDHYRRVSVPLGGSFGIGDVHASARVLLLKEEICTQPELEACSAGHFAAARRAVTRRDGACAACVALVADFEFVANRLDPKGAVPFTERLAAEFDEHLCRDVALRHAAPAYLEEQCDALVEDYARDIASQLSLHAQLTRRGFNPDQSLAKKICGEITHSCDAGEL